MAMSGTTECARCGGFVNAEGKCSVCGVTQGVGGTGDLGSQSQRLQKTKPAFLFNKLTNDRFALTQSVSKIGRDQTNNISITNDHYISRHHAWVLQMQGGYWVEDLGSTNGTLLNGEVLNERKQIFPGDRITFGKTELVFVVD
jgi:pSer/pThr/pTyr-binding forkhead associated (FHA) protein